MKNIKPLYVLILVVLVAIGAFFGGMQYQKSQRSAGRGQFGGGQGQFGNRNGQNRPVTGDIISMDDKSITVKLMDGSSKIVILSVTTAVNKQATGSASDLKNGERVLVIGTQNSDGSITADNISLNPMFRGGTQPTPAH